MRPGLRPRAAQMARQLSGGWRRLVDIARATLHRPDLLILDEPTVGLDPEHREQVWGILNAERRDRGTTILFSTHYLLEAEPADRAVLLANGEVVADGAPAELRSTVGDEVAEVEGPGSARLLDALRARGVVVSVRRTERGYRVGIVAGPNASDGARGGRPRYRAHLGPAEHARGRLLHEDGSGGGLSALSTIHGIVVRDLRRSSRQTGRLLGGLARPFMWLLLVGTGYNAIARVEGGVPYQAYVLPGIIVMAALFGGMLTAIATVYDREFGMLRLMLASPAGIPSILAGRALAATLLAILQGGIVLACAPFIIPLTRQAIAAAAGALAVGSVVSASLGLLVAARLRSVENFAGVINVVLFPLLFVSGALYPTAGMPAALRALAGQSGHLRRGSHAARAGPAGGIHGGRDIGVLLGVTAMAFALTALLFDPEQRLVGRARPPA